MDTKLSPWPPFPDLQAEQPKTMSLRSISFLSIGQPGSVMWTLSAVLPCQACKTPSGTGHNNIKNSQAYGHPRTGEAILALLPCLPAEQYSPEYMGSPLKYGLGRLDTYSRMPASPAASVTAPPLPHTWQLGSPQPPPPPHQHWAQVRQCTLVAA